MIASGFSHLQSDSYPVLQGRGLSYNVNRVIKISLVVLALMALFNPGLTQRIAGLGTSRIVAGRIDALVKAAYGPGYGSGSILDVDERIEGSSRRVHQGLGYVFEDPLHQLEHALIVVVHRHEEDGRPLNDSSFVGIVRENRMVWCSKPFLRNDDNYPFHLTGFGDLNNDGTTDILVSAALGDRGEEEALWIISPDSSGGKLLNEIDMDGQSTIVAAAASFKMVPSKGRKPMVIKGTERSSDEMGTAYEVVYTWNGLFFAR